MGFFYIKAVIVFNVDTSLAYIIPGVGIIRSGSNAAPFLLRFPSHVLDGDGAWHLAQPFQLCFVLDISYDDDGLFRVGTQRDAAQNAIDEEVVVQSIDDLAKDGEELLCGDGIAEGLETSDCPADTLIELLDAYGDEVDH